MAGGADVLRGIGMFLGTPGVRLLGILPVLLAGVLVLALLGCWWSTWTSWPTC